MSTLYFKRMILLEIDEESRLHQMLENYYSLVLALNTFLFIFRPTKYVRLKHFLVAFNLRIQKKIAKEVNNNSLSAGYKKWELHLDGSTHSYDVKRKIDQHYSVLIYRKEY